MRTLPIDGSPALLLSFDFDGTLHDPSGNPPVALPFFEAIQWLRTTRKAAWGINTGRSMEHLLQGMIESRFAFLPDFVVVREREIFLPNSVGRFVPVSPWNEKCEIDLHKLLKKSRKVLKQIREEIGEHTGAEWIEQAGEPAGIISRTDLEMDWIVARIREIVAPASELGWQRNSIYLRFGHRGYQKGSSLAEVARMFGLGADQTFAMGDSHNDLEMLDVGVARYIACPMNSVEEVKQHVMAQQGYLSNNSYSVGVFEALGHFFQ